MPDSSRILFPVDFSGRSRAAIPFVKQMAKQLDAEVTLLYAIEIPNNLYWMEQVIPVNVQAEQVEAEAQRELLNFYKPEPGENMLAIAQVGDPACAITTFAEHNPPVMIMMATHGYGRFRSVLLGSVAAKVLHDSPFPVWTAAHTADDLAAGRVSCQRIVCAVALDASSLGLLRHAAAFAARIGASLRLVHSLANVPIDVDAAAGIAYQSMLMQSARDRMDQLQKAAGTDFQTSISPLPPSEMIREAVENGADLAIVGRGHMHDRLGALRSGSYGIIHTSPCPVLSW
jgi:nucleotide-binding universal stress UspA family protein